jgi:hypothetical protein
MENEDDSIPGVLLDVNVGLVLVVVVGIYTVRVPLYDEGDSIPAGVLLYTVSGNNK